MNGHSPGSSHTLKPPTAIFGVETGRLGSGAAQRIPLQNGSIARRAKVRFFLGLIYMGSQKFCFFLLEFNEYGLCFGTSASLHGSGARRSFRDNFPELLYLFTRHGWC